MSEILMKKSSGKISSSCWARFMQMLGMIIPNDSKLLVWLNRQDENTAVSKLDGNMMANVRKTTNIALGYVKVKPSDSSLVNQELAFIDLVRLAVFGHSLMLRKSNGLSLSIPKTILELDNLL